MSLTLATRPPLTPPTRPSCPWVSGCVRVHRGHRLRRYLGDLDAPAFIRAATERASQLVTENQYERTDSDRSGRTYSHRWVVGGHWAHQPYGPQQSLRKLIYREPYIKGP